jgi:hypothetical protein
LNGLFLYGNITDKSALYYFSAKPPCSLRLCGEWDLYFTAGDAEWQSFRGERLNKPAGKMLKILPAFSHP